MELQGVLQQLKVEEYQLPSHISLFISQFRRFATVMISHYEFTPTMQGRLLVAVRDLDPPSGGAEKSLSGLLLGLENWAVKVYQSEDILTFSKNVDFSI